MKAIDFFCGAGGLTYGLLASGINVIAGIDIDNSYKETYTRNNYGVKFINNDIRQVNTDNLRKILPEIHINDSDLLFAGCAPCQAFSKQRKSIKKRDDENILLYFGNLVSYFLPGQVLIENVRGIEKSHIFKDFLELLEKNNYHFYYEVINAADFGIPQSRKRLILLAMRGVCVNFPEKKYGKDKEKYRTVRETISNLPRINAGEKIEEIPNHQTSSLTSINLNRIRNTPMDGGSWSSWPEYLKLSCHKNLTGYTDVYGRMAWDKPAPTLTCKCHSISNGRFGHPDQDRAISLREAANLQTFPENYIFFGGIVNVARQIGNAVPVKLAEIFGWHIQKLRNG